MGASNQKRILLDVSMWVMILVYGIRYDFGNDYWSYYNLFLDIKTFGLIEGRTDPIWGLLMYVCRPIGYFGFIFLITGFEYYTIYKHIKIYVKPKNWWIAVLIFNFTFNFQLLGCSMMRQFFAICILMYSIRYVSTKQILRFLLILAIAVGIHKTSIIFLLVLLFGIKIPKLNKWYWIALATGFFIGLTILASKYIHYLELAALIFEDDKFNNYLNGDQGSYSFTILFDIFWMILLMYFYPKNRSAQVICMIGVLSYLIFPFTFSVVILSRIVVYFSIYLIFALPNSFSSVKTPALKYGLIVLYSILMIKRTIFNLTGATYGEYYNTFQTILSAEKWI